MVLILQIIKPNSLEQCCFSLDAFPNFKITYRSLISAKKRSKLNTCLCSSLIVLYNYRASNGGAEEDRTPDLLRARQALSQLSYGPFAWLLKESRTRSYYHQFLSIYYHLEMVGLGGFEPPTSPLSGVRSNQLSYRPKLRACSSH